MTTNSDQKPLNLDIEKCAASDSHFSGPFQNLRFSCFPAQTGKYNPRLFWSKSLFSPEEIGPNLPETAGGPKSFPKAQV